MLMHPRTIAGLLSVLSRTILSFQAWADPMVLFSVNDLGGGVFQYNLTVDNQAGSEPLSGLLVLNGGSVFGLDASSVIGAPQAVNGNASVNWGFIAPFLPLPNFPGNILSYFTIDPAGDIPVNASLGGFFFQSTENPANLSINDFAVIGIGASTAGEIPLGNAQLVPEPSSVFLSAFGIAASACLVGLRRLLRRRAARR